jgi:hypothetical protein
MRVTIPFAKKRTANTISDVTRSTRPESPAVKGMCIMASLQFTACEHTRGVTEQVNFKTHVTVLENQLIETLISLSKQRDGIGVCNRVIHARALRRNKCVSKPRGAHFGKTSHLAVSASRRCASLGSFSQAQGCTHLAICSVPGTPRVRHVTYCEAKVRDSHVSGPPGKTARSPVSWAGRRHGPRLCADMTRHNAGTPPRP